jgi:amino acid transporter
LIINIAVTGPTYFGIASQIGFIAPGEPGADFTISAMIGGLFMVPLGIVYFLFSTRMPRSGGDYIWMGRTLNPVLGTIGGWGMWLSFLALLSAGTTTWAAVCVPVFFATLGYAWNIPSFVSFAASFPTPTNIFLGAMLCVLLGVLITSFGAQIYSRVMIVLAAIIMLGTFVYLGIVATTSQSAFAAAVSNYGGVNVTYNGIIALAQQSGWSYTPVNLSATLLSIPFGVLLFNGFNYSAVASGEMRDVRKSMLYGILGGLLLIYIVDSLGLYWTMNVVGYQFNQAAFALFANGKWPFAAPPWVALFIPMVIQNGAVLFFVQLGWILFFIWWAAALLLAASRYVFAFSFDRILPSAFADVNERFRSPLKAMGLNVILGAIFVYLTSFTTYVGQLLNVTSLWAIVWVLVGIAAIVFPYRRKDLAGGMPGGKWLSFFGVLTVIAFSITFYYAATTPSIGPSTIASDVLLTVLFGSGLLVYAIAYFYHKSHGIDLGLIGRQIPLE